MKEKLLPIATTFKKALNGWIDDQTFTQSAALSYYAVFSIAPLILISLAVSGFIYGGEAARNEIFNAFAGLLGKDGASGLQSMVESASKQPSTGVLATVIGVFTLLLGSTSVFAQLQDSLNRIWHVEPIPGAGFRSLVRQRVLSFAMVLVIAFLLLISLLLSAALVAIGKYLEGNLPGGNVLWQAMNAVVSYFITAFLFGAIYKVLPDVQLQWRDVRVGALITAAFFTIGKFLIGFYLGKSSIASAYGLAGSIVIFLTWAYYSSAVLLLGAEFTYHYREVKGESQPDLIIG